MPWLIILIVIISVVSSKNKKKKAEEARRAARRQAFEPPSVREERSVRNAGGAGNAKYPASSRHVTMEELSQRNASAQAEAEMRRRAAQAHAQQAAAQRKPLQQQVRPADTTLTHVVKPMTESSHAHTESSMGGGQECPAPVSPVPTVKKAAPVCAESEPRIALPKLGFTRDELVKGMLYAEILGKPKALRR